ncbi:MAG: CCA tRNA nucleotidyltransferase [Paracoccaceae bacterium]
MTGTGLRITDGWIRGADLQAVLGCLTAAGHQAYLVGGCVRDALLSVPVNDIDIATDARPERVAELASAAGLKVVPTGIEHGTLTIVAAGKPYEVTSFRRDVESDGRRAVIAYSAEIAEDAARRDFTMNALYADAEGHVIAPLGGVEDLLARRVRFVGRPEDRIREDYLRILRFFRFHALYGDPEQGLDAEGLAASAANLAGIDTLSRERIGHEMSRLLAATDPAPALGAMQASGVLAKVLPGADARALGPLVHLEAGRAAPRWLRRLAALGGEDAAGALRLTRADARHLAELGAAVGNGAGAAELAYRFGADAAEDILLLRAALLEAPLGAGDAAAIALGAGARFPLTGADLAGRFSGPALGAELQRLERRWIASGFQLSREQLLA